MAKRLRGIDRRSVVEGHAAGIAEEDESASPFTQIGQSGLKRASGLIYEEFLPILAGTNAIKVYREMSENDSVAGAMLFAIDMFMRKAKWNVQPADDSEEARENSTFLETCMDDMSHTWVSMISDINSMLTFGWSWMEITYKIRNQEIDKWGKSTSDYDDGKIGWKNIEIRSQDSFERWDFDEEDGDIRGLWQRPPPDYDLRYIPRGKSLLFRTTSKKNSPEGQSVLRTAYRSWYFKKRLEEIEGIGVERDLAGLPFAEVPAEMMRDDASAADKQALQAIIQLVKNVRRDEAEGIVWPQTWDENGNKMYEFSLLSSGGSRQFDTTGIIQRYETRIAMTVLADFLLLGSNDTHGSFALSTSKTGMFQAALGAWMDMIAATFNDEAIPALFRLNNIKTKFPKIVPEDVQKPSLADLATFVAALAGAGAHLFPDTELENYFRKLAFMPLKDVTEHEKQEDEIRNQQLDTALEIERAKQKQAKKGILPGAGGGLGGPPQQQPAQQQPGSSGSERKVAGSPTKTTGKVKSKLPPQSRRRTKAVNAGENVAS